MANLKLFSVSDRYVSYLRHYERLKNVFDNKESERVHSRKYIGAAFSHGGYHYYIPLSSPKATDYCLGKDGERTIRKDTISIIRITALSSEHKEELLGTLKLSNMIPVPESELVPYSINAEKDFRYKNLVSKEYGYIKANASKIMKNARILYNQRTYPEKYFQNRPVPGYVINTVDFTYAEFKCKAFSISTSEKIL